MPHGPSSHHAHRRATALRARRRATAAPWAGRGVEPATATSARRRGPRRSLRTRGPAAMVVSPADAATAFGQRFSPRLGVVPVVPQPQPLRPAPWCCSVAPSTENDASGHGRLQAASRPSARRRRGCDGAALRARDKGPAASHRRCRLRDDRRTGRCRRITPRRSAGRGRHRGQGRGRARPRPRGRPRAHHGLCPPVHAGAGRPLGSRHATDTRCGQRPDPCPGPRAARQARPGARQDPRAGEPPIPARGQSWSAPRRARRVRPTSRCRGRGSLAVRRPRPDNTSVSFPAGRARPPGWVPTKDESTAGPAPALAKTWPRPPSPSTRRPRTPRARGPKHLRAGRRRAAAVDAGFAPRTRRALRARGRHPGRHCAVRAGVRRGLFIYSCVD